MNWHGILLLVVLIIAGCGGSDGSSTVSQSKTVALFQFDEGAGSATRDSSGSLLTASINGGASWVSGMTGSALSFENGTAEVLAAYPSSYLASSTFSVEAWLYPKSIPAGTPRLIVGDAFSWLLRMNNGVVEFWLNYGLGSQWAKVASATAPLSAGAWHYVAATYNGSRAALYIDGVAAATSSSVYTVGNDEFHRTISIGGSSGCCSYIDYVQSFPGVIDKVRISGVELSAADIAATYSGPY